MEYESKKAEKNLQKTIETVHMADQVHQRKMSDIEFKNNWL
jgi:hypothetical protein